ncbi:MAG: Oligosaccharide biosynthesis protein Alg14 like protein [Candidatus Gottesmanbacteria bacterium GW2011_GWA1_43_11]|uniref:Oligosaccharide biosynthesis protein Alg14 like protein n=1 Tax=Candidatus Gottesmanbacteria bacterium GW2011_GWA1_43_11 TaxID=1618436 RepID=A0A0G1CG89_9BACT|nr:MAG: Oligosaccharide biosynthesis protein Alg14 like protein [Candidatus Gottesmanbacteria bacterium GW2011_GWA1_43_11]
MRKKSKKSAAKICLVSSGGGHLFQLYMLRNWWSKYDRFWVTFDRTEVRSMLAKEKKYYAFFPESRNIINAFRNSFLAIKILMKERPSLLISCGAGIAPPFFFIGKLLGIRLIFIEPYDFVKFPSLSAKLVEPVVDVLLVQHKMQLKHFKHAQFHGSLL